VCTLVASNISAYPSPMPATTSRGLVTVDLLALKPEVERHAAAVGERPSTWLRKLVERELGSSVRQCASPSPSAIPDPSALVKTTLRLEARALARLAELAGSEGVTRARWIERRVLNQTTASTLTPDRLEALTRSTYELAGLGRQLSEIAKRLDKNPALMTRVERQAIAGAIRMAQAHVDMASSFVAGLAPAQRLRRTLAYKTE
jgi:hypothetical protein